MREKNPLLMFTLLATALMAGCAAIETTGTVVGVVAKVGWEATKAVGHVVWTGAQMTGQTANQANKSMNRPTITVQRTTVSGGRTVVPLEKDNKSFYVRARVNGKEWGRFLVDTGATAVQITKKMANRLRIDPKKIQAIPVTLAGGATVVGRMVVLNEVELGEVKVRNVRAIILDHEGTDASDGLLGMSFLENFVFQVDTKRNELILESK